MVNPIYPQTGQQAMQQIKFVYANSTSMEAELCPQPRVPGAMITHVDVETTSSRWTNAVTSQHATLIQAGTAAWHDAQTDAMQSKTQIAEIHITGEEFLAKHDVETITGNAVPVTVV